MYIKKRGLDAENDLFLGKANKLVRLQFGDFPEFETSWLVKATWENMTFFGEKSKVISFFLKLLDYAFYCEFYTYLFCKLEVCLTCKFAIQNDFVMF